MNKHQHIIVSKTNGIDDDADFIAHSRQDIEMLLEMVETYEYFFKLAAPVETHFHLKTTGELLKEMRKELEKIAEKYT